MLLGMRSSLPGFSPAVSQNFLTNTTVPSWLDVSATTGNRMLYNSTGKLTYAPNNLLTYSNTFSNAAWQKLTTGSGVTPVVTDNFAAAPNGTQTATRIQFNLGATPTSATSRVFQNPNFAGTNLATIWLKTNDGSTKTIYLQGGTAAATIVVTGSWSQFTRPPGTLTNFTFGLNGPSGAIGGLTTDTTADILVWGATLSLVTYETSPRPGDQVITTTAAYYGPRFDYDPSTLAAKGLLIEESRANLCLYSQNLFGSGFWTKTNLTATDSATISPDGTSNASLLKPDATNSNTHLAQTLSGITVTNAAAYTWSWYVKPAGYQWVGVSAYTGGISYFTWFQLTGNGTIGTSAAGNTATITALANGWYRISVSRTTSSTTAYNILYVANADNQPTFAGDGTSGLYVWGAQLEAGSFATSYIPTTSASVTRAADIIKLSGAAFGSYFSSTNGTVVVQINRVNTNGRFASAYDNSNLRLVDISFSGGTSIINFSNNTGGGTLTLSNSFPTTGQIRCSFGWALNNFGGAVNGGSVATDTSVAVDITPTVFAFGSYPAGSSSLNGHIQSFALYNQRLPDAILKQKSTVGGPL